MLIGSDEKQPREKLVWPADFSQWLPAGDTISNVESDVRVLSGTDDTPLTLDEVRVSDTGVQVVVSGGTNGVKYRVQLLAHTAGGLRREAEFDIAVKEI